MPGTRCHLSSLSPLLLLGTEDFRMNLTASISGLGPTEYVLHNN